MFKISVFAIFFACLFCVPAKSTAQKTDSIYFNLYTDSLKRNVHNYINVVGKLSNGKWAPLTSREIIFTSSAGKFEGNDLILDSTVKDEKVTIKAVLREDQKIWKDTLLYIKKAESTEKLKTKEEILGENPRNATKKKKGKKEKNL
ncbi:MAG: hypothetical protein SFU87_20505 [Chitinophagaceae bacterium]|nr:hypothetical protein [Chitinophagaceae bacterium]